MTEETTQAPPEPKFKPTDSFLVRLARAQAEAGELTRDVEITTKGGAKYNGVSASQVVGIAKGILQENGIAFIPVQDKASFKIIEDLRIIWVDMWFYCIENSDMDKPDFVSGAWGEGADRSDKGAAKAFTNANKNVLAKVLELTTTDDAAGDHENTSKDGKTQGKGTPQADDLKPFSEAESKKKCASLIAALPAYPMTNVQAETFAINYRIDLNRLTDDDADAVRAEFLKRKQKKKS
jgi:hypothetical protein